MRHRSGSSDVGGNFSGQSDEMAVGRVVSRHMRPMRAAEEERVTTGGFSSKRLARVRELLERHVDSGFVPGAVAVLARHGEVHVEATGTSRVRGRGSTTPMAGDTICRMGSMTKPIVAACAMTLVEDCTLRLDDPVDDLLPELATMTVLADPDRAAGRHRCGEPPDHAAGSADLHPRHRHGPGRAGNGPDRRRAGHTRRADRRTSGSAGSARFRSSTSRVSAGCTTPPPT